MIFVTLGSQKFQFNRILKEIDKLVEEGNLTENVFAQIGYSDYKPKNYRFKDFLDRDEFSKMMNMCEIVITHGGTGTIIGSIKRDKKVIAIPRLEKYGEHVDDHQIQIVSQFKKMELILGIYETEELREAISKISRINLKKYVSNTEKIISSLDEYIINVTR